MELELGAMSIDTIVILCNLSMSVPGSLRWRARNVLLGSVLGAAFCLPLGNRSHLKYLDLPLLSVFC